MPIPIVKTDLEQRVGAAEVGRYSRGFDANVTSAIAQAWDRVRSVALNWFTPASFDALTAMTLPGEAYLHLVSDAVNILSFGSKRPDEIQKLADEAAIWRGWFAGDKVRAFDDVLIRIGQTDPSINRNGVTWQSTERRLGGNLYSYPNPNRS